MNEIEAIDRELERLHKTLEFVITYPDRITGDLLAADVYGNIEQLQFTLKEIAIKNNNLP